MRPTLFGFQSLAFYASMVLAYFASPYANLSFLLLAFLTLTGLFGLWWGLRNMRGVGAELAELEPIPSGRGNRLRARAHASAARLGRRGAARFGIRVRLRLESGEVLEGLAPVLPEREGATMTLEVPGLARGIYPVVRAEVLSTYPLGLFERRRAIAAPGELAVYPAPSVDTEARTGAQLLAEVLGSTAQGGEQLQPAGLRDYVEGDSLRSIHWRATARRGHPVVREWDGSGGGLELCIDRRATEDELEEALGITSAVLRLAREQKEALSISSQGLSETYGPGHRPWDELLRFLAQADRLEPDAPAPPPVSPAVTRLPVRGGSPFRDGSPVRGGSPGSAKQPSEVVHG